VQFLLTVAPGMVAAADDRQGRLPLHAAVDHQSMLTYSDETEELVAIVRLLIERHPEALQQSDANGNRPLHAAATRYAPMPVLRGLTVSTVLMPSKFGTTKDCCRSNWRCTGSGPRPSKSGSESAPAFTIPT
jgi:hypothetical protein